VSATRRVLLPASVPRRSRARPSLCTADWGCCSTTPPVQGANAHALQEDLDANWGG
jgi:hypothetical protein